MKEDLNSLRKDINSLDRQILELLQKRIEVAKKVGKYKKKNNIPVLDESRERQVIENVQKMAEYPVGKIWKEIIEVCKGVEE